MMGCCYLGIGNVDSVDLVSSELKCECFKENWGLHSVLAFIVSTTD